MSDPAPPTARGAVFISYAREDTDAARRIAEALRSQGVEVWFDQNELRGGDAWDAKIRRQIADCALFLPVVSQHTQDRSKGYFRLEWKLAVEQTHLMAEGVPYLAPVAIDDTSESSAVVPPEFMKVQWTRLPGALPSPEFVGQIKRLLEAPKKSAPGPHLARASAAPGSPGPRSSGIPIWLVATAGLVLLGVGGYFALRPSAKEATPAAKSVAETKSATVVAPAAAAPAAGTPATPVHTKSIAVLPFANLSDDKENTAFFSDGMHEDILTHLANIRELRVVSRTSVLEYRGTTKKIPQIGRELGVAYVLEGSVRRSGNQVRLTGQLIRAATDEHLWAKSYDRELTPKEMFSIQAALSTEIATALRAAISPEETKQITRRPTESLAAYDLFLKGREKTRTSTGFTDRFEAEQLLESAVNLDPGFVDAWTLLAYVHAFNHNRDRSATQLEKAARSMETVLRLAPGTPAAMRAEGDFQLYCRYDIPKAAEYFERALRLNPNDADTIKQLSAAERRLGRWVPMLTHVRQYLDLEPSDSFVRRTLVGMLVGGRRYAEAEVVAAQLLKANPDNLQEAFRAALIPFWKSGSKREVEALFARWTKAQCESADGMAVRIRWAVISGDLPETSIPSATGGAKLSLAELGGTIGNRSQLAVFLAARGDTAGVRAATDQRSEALRAQLEKTPAQSQLWSQLGELEALRGNREEALRCEEKAHEIGSESQGVSFDYVRAFNRAFILAWTKDKDGAIAEYARLLSIPQVLAGERFESVHGMKVSPRFAPLRGDPRFEALLNDPKNNAPLF